MGGKQNNKMQNMESTVDGLAERLVEQARTDGVELTGEAGLLTGLVQRVLQVGLEAEMTDHLGYEPHEVKGRGSGNSRNGSYPKTVATDVGDVTVEVPRDRNATFDPVTVPKGVRRLDGVEAMVVSLYGKGMSCADIGVFLEESYGQQVSKDTISRITDRIVDDMNQWQARPLDSLYPVILIDAIVVKIRDQAVENRPIYVVMGINLNGERDILGLYPGPAGTSEGAKYWLSVLTELKNRGVADALVVCCDGLKGLPESITATWPQADVQLCVVHLVRNSLRYASTKYWSAISKDLKLIYTAPTVEAATGQFETFKTTWGEKYPAMTGVWERAWPEFIPFLEFPAELRKIVYTTNAIESLNARFRTAIRKRSQFPTEQAALKVMYLTAIEKRKNRKNPTGRTQGWKQILNVLTIHYGERITDHM